MVGAVVLMVVLGVGSGASAHPELVASTPGQGQVLDALPASASLAFNEPVIVVSSKVFLRAPDGSQTELLHDGASRTSELRVPLPGRASNGTYAITFDVVGDDGHRIRGEVGFAVGASYAGVGGAQSEDVASGSAARALASLTWFVGVVLVAGAALVGWWFGRGEVDVDRRGSTRRRLDRYAVVAGVTSSVGAVVNAVVALSEFAGDAPWAESLGPFVGSRSGGARVAVVLIAGSIALAVARTRARTRLGCQVLLGLLAAASAIEVTAGHGGSGADPLTSTVVGAVHLLSIASWLGLLVSWFVVVRPDDERPGQDHGGDEGVAERERRAYLRSMRGAGGASFVAALVTGTAMAVDRAGLEWWASEYGQLVLLKAAIVVVLVAPLAVLHHVRAASDRPASPTVGWRTLKVEVVAGFWVLAVAAVLVGQAPPRSGDGAGPDTVSTSAATPGTASGSPARSLNECTALPPGDQVPCLKEHFAALTSTAGPDTALSELAAHRSDNPTIAEQCHQLAHGIGRVAVRAVGGVDEAFAHSDAMCSAGYFHGVMEESLGTVADRDLRSAVPTLCAGGDNKGPDQFNCLHGLGHGLVLRVKGSLFGALQLCDALGPGSWEQDACAGGAFMQNLMNAGEGDIAAVADPNRPLYPCTAVEQWQKSSCYLMVTSLILNLNGRDIDKAFAACDGAEAAYVPSCYQSLGRDISGQTITEVRPMLELCQRGSREHLGDCLIGAATSTANEHQDVVRANQLCDAAPEDVRPHCANAVEGMRRVLDAQNDD